MASEIPQQPRIAEAWRHFVNTGEVDSSALRPEIAASWRRSSEAMVDPKDALGRLPAGQRGIDDLRDDHCELIEVARPFMSSLHRFVVGSGFIVILADERGRVMEMIGDEDALDRASLVNLVPGSSWSEHNVGTNGIGTALASMSPLQVSGYEHYCERLHAWTCSAGPILEEHGQALGALQMSGPSTRTHAHTLGMGIAFDDVEMAFKTPSGPVHCLVAAKPVHDDGGSINGGVVSLNPSKRITKLISR